MANRNPTVVEILKLAYEFEHFYNCRVPVSHAVFILTRQIGSTGRACNAPRCFFAFVPDRGIQFAGLP